MVRVILLLAVLIAIYGLSQWYRALPPVAKARARRGALVGVPIAALVVLAAMGRVHWMVAAAAPLLLFLRRLLALLFLIPLFRQLFALWGRGRGPGGVGGGPHQPPPWGNWGGGQAGGPPPGGSGAGRMSRDEAYSVLGLKPGASREEVLAAHRRLIQKAHPDQGGSDYLAAKINQARDLLLGKS